MKKNSTLSKKLKSYSALAGSIAATITAANAQIVYTDVSPDVLVNGNGSGYGLDLDNDGNADYLFAVLDTIISSNPIKRVAVIPYQAGNAVGATTQAGSNATYIYPLAMNAGAGIGAGLSWKSASSVWQSMASVWTFGSFGNWLGVTDKYIPLRFMIGSTVHYGWARFDVPATADAFTIKDYAYNGSNDGGLQAGAQSGTGVGAVKPMDIAIYSFENKINLVFGNSTIANGTVTVTNVLGQEIKSENINAQIMHIDMSGVASGTYMVVVKGNDGSVTTKKVFIN